MRGIVLETFGVGNMPDLPVHGWIPWLRAQRKKGLQARARNLFALVTHPPRISTSISKSGVSGEKHYAMCCPLQPRFRI